MGSGLRALDEGQLKSLASRCEHLESGCLEVKLEQTQENHAARTGEASQPSLPSWKAKFRSLVASFFARESLPVLADTDTVTAPEDNEQSNLVWDDYDCAFTSLEGSGNMRPMTLHRSESMNSFAPDQINSDRLEQDANAVSEAPMSRSIDPVLFDGITTPDIAPNSQRFIRPDVILSTPELNWSSGGETETRASSSSSTPYLRNSVFDPATPRSTRVSKPRDSIRSREKRRQEARSMNLFRRAPGVADHDPYIRNVGSASPPGLSPGEVDGNICIQTEATVFHDLAPETMAKVRRIGDEFLRRDLSDFLDENLETWKTTGFWDLSFVTFPASQIHDINVEQLFRYAEAVKIQNESTALKLRVVRVLVFLLYVREAELKRRSGLRGKQAKTEAINSLLKRAIAPSRTEERVRSAFHIHKRIGMRWWWFAYHVSLGVLLSCSEETANKVLVSHPLGLSTWALTMH